MTCILAIPITAERPTAGPVHDEEKNLHLHKYTCTQSPEDDTNY